VRAYRGVTLALAAVTAGLGVALVAVTVARGGGAGILLGALFVLAGGGRLYAERRRAR
jgi:hypothetical protein